MVEVALYGRVSTVDKGQEVENQLAELRRFAASQGWTIYAEYVDHETGKHAERPRFRDLFNDASKRRFDVVLFWALDRFTREGALETLQHLNVLSGYGVGFRSFSEPYLDSCGIFKDAVIAILGTIAKQERVRISQRVRAGLERARANGTRTGRAIGRPTVVFRRDTVAEMRSNGVSWREIARRTGVSVRTLRRTSDTHAVPLGGVAKPIYTAVAACGTS
jgi:DNA invertase Pin-like site-specific DNA recombinase